jgi:hypothetical protein
MKRSLLALFALAMIGMSTGCCGWWGHHGYAPGGYPAGACPSGNCPPGQQGFPSGSYYAPESTQSVNMGVPQPIEGPVTYGPVIHHSAQMPLESLPTF